MLLVAGLSFASVAPEDGVALSVCHNFGCKARTDLVLGAQEWRSVMRLFEPPATSALQERDRLRRAVARLELLVGRYAPTRVDRGGNPIFVDRKGQMDCIDESTNTTAYLRLLENTGLLRYHRVLQRIYRAPFVFDQHWAAQIEELGTQRRYAVDSWFLDNGEPPYIQAVEAWRHKQRFRDGLE
jgi:hypothetical protein